MQIFMKYTGTLFNEHSLYIYMNRKETLFSINVLFSIVRNRGSFGVVEVSWEMQTMENTLLPEGSQFKNTSGTIIFQQQEGRQPLAITPLADQIPELQETFKAVLTGVRGE